MSESNAISR